MNKDLKSKCCQAVMRTEGSKDFGDGSPEDVSTCYYVCEKCKEPCDIFSDHLENRVNTRDSENSKIPVDSSPKQPRQEDYIVTEWLNSLEDQTLKSMIMLLLTQAREEERRKAAEIVEEISCFCSMHPCLINCSKNKAKQKILNQTNLNE